VQTTKDAAGTEQASWRIDDWLRAAGHPFQRPKLYGEIHAGRIAVRKIGRRRLVILTSPRAYFESLPDKVGPPVTTCGGRRKVQP
jgi:hypothetical protein